MTSSEIAPNTPVVHPMHGVGLALTMHGRTRVEVMWPGMTMTRRELIEDVEVYVAPVEAPKRRRRTTGA